MVQSKTRLEGGELAVEASGDDSIRLVGTYATPDITLKLTFELERAEAQHLFDRLGLWLMSGRSS